MAFCHRGTDSTFYCSYQVLNHNNAEPLTVAIDNWDLIAGISINEKFLKI